MQVKKIKQPKSKKHGKQVRTRPKPKLPGPSRFMGPSGKASQSIQAKVAKDDAYIVAIANPFDVRALGAKIPDQNNLPSTPIKMNGSFFGQVNAAGTAAWVFRAYPYLYNAIGSVSGGNVTWPATGIALPQATSLGTQFTSVRVVSWGIRITMSGNVANTQGRLHIAIVPNVYPYANGVLTANPLGVGYPDTVAEWQNCPYYECYSLNELRDNRVIVPGRIIDQGAFRYRATQYAGFDTSQSSLTISSQLGMPIESADGHSSICIFVEGAAANQTVLAIEYVSHLEGYVNFGSGSIVNQSTPARPHNPGVLEVANALAIHMPPTFFQADKLADMKNVIQKIATGVTFTKHMLPLVSKAFKGLRL